jgi:two-component system, response regulator
MDNIENTSRRLTAVTEPVEILLVEDNPDDVELTLRALKRANLANRIAVARDGAEALRFIFGNETHPGSPLQNDPGIILLDLNLPEVDGVEVLRRVKADCRTQSIPVIVLTSSREDVDRTECYKLDINSYIVKPVDFVQFAQAIRILGFHWALVK